MDARIWKERPYSVLGEIPHFVPFVTLSGSHLYGFASANSDFDLRGMHVASPDELLGLGSPKEQWDTLHYTKDGYDDDVVTLEAKKFMLLVLNNNGNVLEQIYSPLVVKTSPFHEELKAIAKQCLTKNHYKHYCGFSLRQWNDFNRRPDKRCKRILYTFRTLMTGVHLLRTGEVEPNITVLNETFKLPYITELVQAKVNGTENEDLPGGHGLDFYKREFERVSALVYDELERTKLPAVVPEEAKAQLNDLLLGMRHYVSRYCTRAAA